MTRAVIMDLVPPDRKRVQEKEFSEDDSYRCCNKYDEWEHVDSFGNNQIHSYFCCSDIVLGSSLNNSIIHIQKCMLAPKEKLLLHS